MNGSAAAVGAAAAAAIAAAGGGNGGAGGAVDHSGGNGGVSVGRRLMFGGKDEPASRALHDAQRELALRCAGEVRVVDVFASLCFFFSHGVIYVVRSRFETNPL